MKRFLLLFLALCALPGTMVFAQTATLAITTNKTVVDGTVNPIEYAFSQDLGKAKLYVNRTADTLYVAVVGSTSGWVAFGLGSQRMDGATIFMGYVDSSGKSVFKPQAGRGHGHGDAAQAVQDSVISSAMTEVKGVTTLEVALKPAAYVKAGQTALDVIVALGMGDSFMAMHSFKSPLAINLAK